MLIQRDMCNVVSKSMKIKCLCELVGIILYGVTQNKVIGNSYWHNDHC
jgi:hypothetical protein